MRTWLPMLTAVLLATTFGFGVAAAAVVGDCTEVALAAAIDDANADPDLTTITLAGDCIYVLTTALPDITAPLVIEGNGATIEGTGVADEDPNAAEPMGLLFVEGLADLTVRDLILRGGAAFVGGAIAAYGDPDDLPVGPNESVSARSFAETDPEEVQSLLPAPAKDGAVAAAAEHAGTIVIERVTFEGNGGILGGAVFSGPHTLTMTDSTLRDNLAFGGGALAGWGAATISGTTFENNVANFGGAAAWGLFDGPTVDFVNSTLSTNGALRGGALYGFAPDPAAPGGSIRLIHTTVTRSGFAGPLGVVDPGDIPVEFGVAGAVTANATASDVITLNSTILAEQKLSTNCGAPAALTSLGHNLSDDDSCGLAGTGDIEGGVADLGPLELEPGALTATHALGGDSQALDAIDPDTPADAVAAAAVGDGCLATGVTSSQAGTPRPFARGCDIGAFESRQGTLHVALSTTPAGLPLAADPAFGFTLEPTPSVDEVAFELRDGGLHVQEGVPADTYTLQTVVPHGWLVTDIVCADPTLDTVVDIAAATATIEMAFAETIACTVRAMQLVGPTVDAGGPYTTRVGTPRSLAGVVNPGTGDIASLAWTVDDPSCSFSDATIAAPTVTCTTAGEYDVTLTALDEHGLTAADTGEVLVSGVLGVELEDPDGAPGQMPDTGGGSVLLGLLAVAMAAALRRRPASSW